MRLVSAMGYAQGQPCLVIGHGGTGLGPQSYCLSQSRSTLIQCISMLLRSTYYESGGMHSCAINYNQVIT